MRWSSVILILLSIQLVNCDPLDKTENEQRLQSCGKNIKRKVYQGVDVSQSEAPWSLFFLINGNNGFGNICTGTIVSPRHVLIATHCFADLDDQGWKVNGKLDQANCKNKDYVITDENYLKRITLRSNNVIIAQSPEKVTLVNACIQRKPMKTVNYTDIRNAVYMDDFAIIDLYEELKFSNTINLVCVAEDKSANALDMKLDYFGFGLNPPSGVNGSEAPDSTGVLRHETIHINNRTLMEDYYFLAADKSGNTVACTGDSGGGAIGRINNRKTIIGVLSQTNCENSDKRSKKASQEQYASVGFYSDKICENIGICKSAAVYDKYHKGYVKKEKSVRKPEDIQSPNDGSSRNGPGVVQTVVEKEPDSAIGKCFNAILALMIFVLNF